MHINMMREQYLYLHLEHSLPILDQLCNCGREPNIPKWPAILSMNFTVIFTTCKETSNILIQVSQCKIIFKYIM
jgi:hypothetical protein